MLKSVIPMLLFAALCTPQLLEAQQKPWPVKVVVITTFEEGADAGDAAGELQYWVEREHLDQTLPFPGGVHPLRSNQQHDVIAILTGMTLANAGPSIMALGVDPRFDLRDAYFLVAGVAGVDPHIASVGSAAWARFVVNDVSRELDSREIPKEWPYGVFVIGANKPNAMPVKPMTDDLYTLNPSLSHWAYTLTKSISIPETQEMRQDRVGWSSYPNAAKPPFVLEGDSYASDIYWHGSKFNQYAEDWVSLWTQGHGTFAMANMEDSAIAEALLRLSRMHRINYQRLMVLRTASNFTMQKPGSTAVESVNSPYLNSTAFESAWLVGSTVVHELTHNWNLYQHHTP